VRLDKSFLPINNLVRCRQYKSAQNVARIDGSPEFDDPNDFQALKDEYRISNHCWNKLYKLAMHII